MLTHHQQEISEDRRKSLEALVEDLKEFRDSHDSLAAWLAQKDKMVTVLGPVATEPAMVNNQLQQVKVNELCTTPKPLAVINGLEQQLHFLWVSTLQKLHAKKNAKVSKNSRVFGKEFVPSILLSPSSQKQFQTNVCICIRRVD